MENLVKGVSHRAFHIARLSFQYCLLKNMVRVCLHDKIWKLFTVKGIYNVHVTYSKYLYTDLVQWRKKHLLSV